MKENNHVVAPELLHYFDRQEKRLSKIEELLRKSILPLSKKDWYRTDEACQLLGISRSKLEQFKKSGLFEFRKVGGTIYISGQDLHTLLPT